MNAPDKWVVMGAWVHLLPVGIAFTRRVPLSLPLPSPSTSTLAASPDLHHLDLNIGNDASRSITIIDGDNTVPINLFYSTR